MVSAREIKTDEIRKYAFVLRKGDISKPFTVERLERNPSGEIVKSGKISVYLLKAEEYVPSGRKSLDDVRVEIEKILATKIEAQSQRQWLNRLKRDAFIQVNLPENKISQ